jgi:hypothetical protein
MKPGNKQDMIEYDLPVPLNDNNKHGNVELIIHLYKIKEDDTWQAMYVHSLEC